ncbi:MAG: hypothetical protein NWE99_06575 [Candidatus Bathyarchaeota archaeon]|nr:hypothetical protein [Candidatus Bathyarchaeota archaeon]
MTNNHSEKFPLRVKAYVGENWGAPFIIGFMLFLIIAAASLLMGLSVLANELAVYAYYALIVGVVSQVACYLKSRQQEE